MKRIDEVHIAPLGNEHDRIIEPIRRYRVDIVYLLEHDGKSEPVRASHLALRNEIDALDVETHRRTLDLFDLYDVLGVVTTLASEHPDDIVRANVSSGTKLSAIGAAIACMTTHATPYYVHPEKYTQGDAEKPLSTGVDEIEALPTYPIESPTQDQVSIMDYVDRENTDTKSVNKSDLNEHAEAIGLAFITENEPANEKAKFALLNANIIEPLRENDYIEVESVGRQKQVTLTETGRNVLQAFRHML